MEQLQISGRGFADQHDTGVQSLHGVRILRHCPHTLENAYALKLPQRPGENPPSPGIVHAEKSLQITARDDLVLLQNLEELVDKYFEVNDISCLMLRPSAPLGWGRGGVDGRLLDELFQRAQAGPRGLHLNGSLLNVSLLLQHVRPFRDGSLVLAAQLHEIGLCYALGFAGRDDGKKSKFSRQDFGLVRFMTGDSEPGPFLGDEHTRWSILVGRWLSLAFGAGRSGLIGTGGAQGRLVSRDGLRKALRLSEGQRIPFSVLPD